MCVSVQEPDLKPLDFSWNSEYEPSFVWYDQKLIDAAKDHQDPIVLTFFRLLALCHTVMPNSRTGTYSLVVLLLWYYYCNVAF